MSEVKEGEQEAVVWVRRSSWERVTEREELVGRLSFGSRLPQYLDWDVLEVVFRSRVCDCLLDHCDVYWRPGTCSVYLFVSWHCRSISFSIGQGLIEMDIDCSVEGLRRFL